MWDGIEPAAFDGLRYLKALRGQPVRLSAEMFQAFMNQPRPERKSLTEALKASKGPSGSDIYDWMVAIGWIAVDGDDQVSLTDLGLAVMNAATGTQEVETEVVEVVEETPEDPEVGVPHLSEVTLTVEEADENPPHYGDEQEGQEEPRSIFG